MKFLLYNTLDNSFYQLDNDQLTSELIDEIAEGDVVVFRLHDQSEMFEEYNHVTDTFDEVSLYEGEKEDSHKKILERLEGKLRNQ